jgi:hypothetical protein
VVGKSLICDSELLEKWGTNPNANIRANRISSAHLPQGGLSCLVLCPFAKNWVRSLKALLDQQQDKETRLKQFIAAWEPCKWAEEMRLLVRIFALVLCHSAEWNEPKRPREAGGEPGGRLTRHATSGGLPLHTPACNKHFHASFCVLLNHLLLIKECLEASRPVFGKWAYDKARQAPLRQKWAEEMRPIVTSARIFALVLCHRRGSFTMGYMYANRR